MIKMDNILVAIDFSPVSEGAAAFALQLSRKQQAELHLLTVDVTQQNGSGNGEAPAADHADTRIRTEQERLVDSAGAANGMRIMHKTVRGNVPSSGIVEYAESQGIDLIVTGTEGRRGFRRMVKGSVAAEVVRTAPCPVLTVRKGESNRPQSIRKIVVPVDFSPPSAAAVRYAGRLAELFDAQLKIIHVMERVDNPDASAFRPSVFGTAEKYKRAQERMRELCMGSLVECDTSVLQGNPAEEIAVFAIEQDIDLIVMPTRGQEGLQRLLMGSVAEDVITTAPCPVLSARTFAPYLLEKKGMDTTLNTQERARSHS